MSLDKEIFKGKTLSDLFGEIYDNSKETKGQVKALIGERKPLNIYGREPPSRGIGFHFVFLSLRKTASFFNVL